VTPLLCNVTTLLRISNEKRTCSLHLCQLILSQLAA
jgi:hypothetical protein